MPRKLLLLPLLLVFALLFRSVNAHAQCTIATTPANAFVCKGETESYSVSSPVSGTTYSWTMSPVLGNLSSSVGNNISILWHTVGTTVITVTATNSSGTTTCTATVNVGAIPSPIITASSQVGCQTLDTTRREPPVIPPQFEDGCIKACEGNSVTYTSSGTPSSTYTWNVTGAVSYTTSGNSCTVLWGAPGAGSITVTETTQPNGCPGSKQICVEIIPKPNAIMGAMPNPTQNPITVCVGDTIQFVQSSVPVGPSPLVNWYWDFGDNTTFSSSTPVNPSHHYTNPGTYEVLLVVKNACNCTDTARLRVIVNPGDAVNIVCPGVACERDTSMYSVDLSSISCSQFLWSVVGGTIISPMPYGPTIEVVWDNVGADGMGYVSFDGSACSGPNHCESITTIKIPVVKQIGTISGPNIVCVNSNNVFRLPAWPGTVYNWNVAAGSVPATLSHTDQPNEIVLHTTSATGTIILECNYRNTLLGCGGYARIIVRVVPPTTISASLPVACRGTSGTFTLSGGHLGTWTVGIPNGGTVTWPGGPSNSITVPFNVVGTYVVSASGTTFCAPEPVTTTVYPAPPPPNSITGPTEICTGTTYTYTAGTAIPGTVFEWSISNGTFVGAASGASISAQFFGPGSVSVVRRMVAAPNCASSSISLSVGLPSINLNVTGDNTPCANTYEPYTVAYTGGDSYEWFVTSAAGSVSSGNGSPTANILWNNFTGAAKVWVRVYKCGIPYTDTLDVVVSGVPALSLNLPATICENAAFTFQLNSSPAATGTLTWQFNGSNPNPPATPFSGSSATQSYTYTNVNPLNNIFNVVATLSNVNGCPGSTVQVSGTVTINPAPIVGATPIGPIDLCPPVQALNASTQVGSIPITAMEWRMLPNTVVCSTFCASYTPTAAGTYVAVATGNNGCLGFSNPVVVTNCNGGGGGGCTISPAPTGTLTYTTACGHVQVGITPTPTGTNPTWTWPAPATNVATNTTTLPYTIDADFAVAGTYEFSFTSTYLDIFNQPCDVTRTEQVPVPLVPYQVAGLQCNATNNGYNITLGDISSIATGIVNTTITGYQFFVNSTPVTGLTTTPTYTGPVPTGPTTVTGFIVIHYQYTDPNTLALVTPPPCTTAVATLAVPALPTASFTTPFPNNNCVGTPVEFFANITPALPTSTVHWAFSDGTTLLGVEDPVRVYTAPSPIPFHYTPTLTVTDQFGCVATAQQTIKVSTNPLDGSVAVVPSTICEGALATLSWTGASSPTSFTWMVGSLPLITTGSSSISVGQNGAYWVTVRDGNRCFFHANNPLANLSVINVPEPVISGKVNQCQGVPFTLDGYAGPGVTYSWLMNGNPAGSTPSITLTGLPPSTYTFHLTLSVSGCSLTSAPFVVTVQPTPPKPSLAFTIPNCQPYEVLLSATLPGPGDVGWSNGATGTPTTAWIGGLYKAWYTDQYGCVSSDTISVPKDPQGYLWVFPTGCYNLCPPPGGFTIYGPIIPFQLWGYYNGGSPVLTGGPSIPSPLTINGSGLYSMMLDNGYCNAEIGVLDLTVPDSCKGSQPCEISFEPQVALHYKQNCNVFLDWSMFNSYGANVTVQVIALSPGGTMVPSTFVITPGWNPSNVTQWIPPAPFAGNATFLLVFTLPDGSTCSQEVYVYNIRCPYGNGLVYRQAAPAVVESGIATVEAATLHLAPNPARDATVVHYSFGSTAQKRTVQVFDAVGRLLASLDAEEVTGRWELKLDGWAAGMYQVVLKADGEVVAYSKLSVTH